jgi:arylsulfatase A-like enzyme
VHVPIHPVHELLDKYRRKTAVDGQGNADYATMVENLDRNIGLLIKSLERKELDDNTLIFFSSDNGGLNGITRQMPLRAGKGSYYEGGIRIPFALVRVGQIMPGSVSEVPVTQIDIFPTVLEAAGIGTDEYDCDGISLWPVLKGGNGTQSMIPNHSMSPGSRPLFWHFPVYLEAYETGQDETRDSLFRTRPGSVIRYGDWKLHFYYEDGGLELYNLNQDPGERHNLAESNPQKTEELYQLLIDWRQRTDAPEPADENPEFEPETRLE